MYTSLKGKTAIVTGASRGLVGGSLSLLRRRV